MKYKNIVIWGIVFCCLFFSLQYKYLFHFYYIEQLQLFPFSWDYLLDTLSSPGGVAFYISGFLLQFYKLSCLGALITSCLFIAIGVLMQRVCKLIAPDISCYLLALLPVLTLLPLHLDMNYRLQGTVAYLFMLIFFLFYIRIRSPWKRIISGFIFLVLLFWLAGPIVFLLGISIVVWEILYRKYLWGWSLFLLLELVSIFYLSFYLAWQGEYRMILLPDYYYEPLLSTEKIYYAWIIFPICLLVAWLLRGKKDLSGIKNFFIVNGQLVVFFIFWGWKIDTDRSFLQENMKQDYYLRTEQWDKIISQYSAEKANLQTLNVLNLALACRNKLGDELFLYPQLGKESLLPEWNSTLPSAIALSEINYHIGNIAFAQKFAFEGCLSSVNSNPRLLQRLVQTNLIFGAYPVAEKYIGILEQTLFYRKWAKGQRKYLYDDSCVEGDSSLGGKRKALIGNGQYAVSTFVPIILEQLAVNNPDNPIAFQYLLAYHLLGKTLSKYNDLYGKYYRTKIWPSLSITHQEAIIALFQKEPSIWAKKGVSLKVEQCFGAFNQDMIDKRGYINFRDVMASSYGNTYWFYLMFKK